MNSVGFATLNLLRRFSFSSARFFRILEAEDLTFITRHALTLQHRASSASKKIKVLPAMAKKKNATTSGGSLRPIATTSLPSKAIAITNEDESDRPSPQLQNIIGYSTIKPSETPTNFQATINAQTFGRAQLHLESEEIQFAQLMQTAKPDAPQQHHLNFIVGSRLTTYPLNDDPTHDINDRGERSPEDGISKEHHTETNILSPGVQVSKLLSISTKDFLVEESFELNLARTKIEALQNELSVMKRSYAQELSEMRRKLTTSQERHREAHKQNHKDEVKVLLKEKQEAAKEQKESLNGLQKALNLAEYNAKSFKQQKGLELRVERDKSSKMLETIKRLEKEVQNQESGFTEFEKGVDDISGYPARLKKRIDQGVKDLQACKEKSEEKCAILKSKIGALEKERYNLKVELDKEFLINVDVRNENRTLKTDLEMQQPISESLEFQVQSLEQDLRSQNRRISSLLNENRSMKNNNETLKSNSELQARQITHLENVNSAYRTQSELHIRNNANSSTQNQSLRTLSDAQFVIIADLRGTIRDLEKRIKCNDPLVKSAVAVRFRHLEQTRASASNGPVSRNSREIIDAGNKAAHRCNGVVDAALFKSGNVPADRLEEMRAHFQTLYQMEPEEFPGSWSPMTVRVADCIAMKKTLSLGEENELEELCDTYRDLVERILEDQDDKEDFETSEEGEDMLEELEGVIDEIVQTDLWRKRRRGH